MRSGTRVSKRVPERLGSSTMAQPSDPHEPLQPRPASDQSFFDLLTETLEGLDEGGRGAFLRRFFRALAHLDLTEAQSIECWGKAIGRQEELTAASRTRVSLLVALLDVLASSSYLRVPVIVEYDDFRKLQIDAATDPLTGLYNRRLFDEHYEKELKRAKRYSQSLGLVVLDVHCLKDVNDRQGHLKGDNVIQLVAVALRKTLRSSDTAFRIGGDEFALLLPHTDSAQAAAICRRLGAQYQEDLRPLELGIAVALDYGLAVYPQDGEYKGTLLQLADDRLYALKQARRDGGHVLPIEAAASRTVFPAPEKVAEGAKLLEGNPPQDEVHLTQRKWERVSLAGTRSYAALDAPARKAVVLDLSYGGVALLLDQADGLPDQFAAILHVPILPPTRVHLRKVYVAAHEDGRARVGCIFVS